MSRSPYLFVRREIKQTVGIIEAYHLYQLHAKFDPTSSGLTPHAEEIIRDHQNGFRRKRSTTNHKLNFSNTGGKNGNTMRLCISCLETSKRPMVQLGGRSCYNILTEFGIPTKLVRTIFFLNKAFTVLYDIYHLVAGTNK
jgi:hypothetical protein